MNFKSEIYIFIAALVYPFLLSCLILIQVQLTLIQKVELKFGLVTRGKWTLEHDVSQDVYIIYILVQIYIYIYIYT